MIISFILAYFIGVFSVLLLQTFLLYKWWSSKERESPKLVLQRAKPVNPKFIADYLRDDCVTETETCMFLNLVLAFVWREWRDTEEMKDFFLKKMNSEFQDLLQNRTAGKVVEQITIQDFFLGTSLPVIKGVTIMKIGSKDPDDVPAELDLALELEYTGGCHMAIQVDLLFGKSVYLSVKLVYLKGRARLQFSRHPCTHWSLSFYEEADVEFEAESQLDGKTIPRLRSLIINHLRKSLYRKHTLPNYKIRYRPFFPRLFPQDETQEVYIHNSLVTVGHLEVEVISCSRLPELDNIYSLYCTVSVDSIPWSQLAENSRALWPTLELEIHRESSDSSFGLTLSKETDKNDACKTIVIETIVPNSPASLAGFQKGDVLVSVNGQKIESLKQAAKFIKGKNRFAAVIQRHPKSASGAVNLVDGPTDKLPAHPDIKFKSVNVDSDESDSDEEFVNVVVPLLEKHADIEKVKSVKEILTKSIELKQQRSKKRSKAFSFSGRGTVSPATDSDSTEPDTNFRLSKTMESRSESPVKSDTEPKAVQGSEQKQEGVNLTDGDKGLINIQQVRGMKTSDLTDHPGNKKTKEVLFCQDPTWNEIVKFDVEKTDKYLNLCLWGKFHDKNEKDLLIGYITVSLTDIALQCVSTGARKHEQNFVLMSLHIDRVISSRPYLRTHQGHGLEDELCGGDISLIFCHTPSTAECDESVITKQRNLDKLVQQDVSEDKDIEESFGPQEHDFMLTQFYFPTRCNYCNKKVWTKVACQCRNCAMICHKKCLEACRTYTNCMLGSGKKSRWFTRKPGRVKSEARDDQEKAKDRAQIPNKDSEAPTSGAGETPETSDTAAVESRVDEEPITEDKEKDNEQGEKEATPSANSSSSETEMEREIPGPGPDAAAEDMLAACVRIKEIGKELFSNLATDVRKEKLQSMMERLQTEIDEENETRLDLYESLSKAKEEKKRAALHSLLAKSEERSQALAMLILQYCAGLQNCTEAVEHETYQL